VIAATFYGFPTLVVPFDECTGVRNALSLPIGVILFGRNLATSILVNTQSAVPVAGSLAHEWAHQLQFRNGWMRPTDSTARTTELEADAFSGVYMGLVKGFGTATLQAYFSTLASFGDYSFNSPSHHGTPTERVAAGLLGLAVADDMIRNGSRPTFLQLHNLFTSTIGPSALIEAMGVSAAARANINDIQRGGIPNIPERGPGVAGLGIRPLD
jgi:hypothetical protein